MKKLNKKIPIMIGAVIGLILVIYICLCFLASGNGFIKNMTINGIKVNNMSKEEVISKLENKYQKDQDQLLLNLEMNGQKYQIDMKDNVKVNIKDQVNDIQKKYNNFFTKGYHYLLKHNENISIDIKDQKKLNKKINKILKDVKIEDLANVVDVVSFAVEEYVAKTDFSKLKEYGELVGVNIESMGYKFKYKLPKREMAEIIAKIENNVPIEQAPILGRIKKLDYKIAYIKNQKNRTIQDEN